jgi:hypothetical protein
LAWSASGARRRDNSYKRRRIGENAPEWESPALVERVRDSSWRSLAGLTLLLAPLALVLGWLAGVDPLETWHGRRTGVLWGFAAAWPPLALLAWLARLDWRPFNDLRALVRDIVQPLAGRSVFAPLALSVAAGVGEEVFFRGFLQARLERDLGPYWGLAVAALVFGALHAASRLYFLIATVLGVYLGLVWRIVGDLAAPVVCHAVYDLAAIYWILCLPKPPIPTTDASEPSADHAPL